MHRGQLHARSCRHDQLVDGPYRPSGRTAYPSGITPPTIMSPTRSHPGPSTEIRLSARAHPTTTTHPAHAPPPVTNPWACDDYAAQIRSVAAPRLSGVRRRSASSATNEGTRHMIVIGADTHKRNHTLVALDGQTGALRGQLGDRGQRRGALDALRFAAGLDAERVWAIEDCRHVSARLESALMAAGERVIRVPAAMTGQTRKVSRRTRGSLIRSTRARSPGPWSETGSTAPVAFCDEQAMEIRVLSDYRDQIDHRAHPDDQPAALASGRRSPPSSRPDPARRADQAPGSARSSPAGSPGCPAARRLRVAKRMLKRISEIGREERELLAELTALIEAHAPQLLDPARLRHRDRRDHHRPHRRRASASRPTGTSPATPAPPRSPPQRARPNATACTAAATANSTAPSTSSRSPAPAPTPRPAPTSPANTPRARPSAKPSAASNATSPAASGACSTPPRPQLRRRRRYRPCHLHRRQDHRSAPSSARPRDSCHAHAETRK